MKHTYIAVTVRKMQRYFLFSVAEFILTSPQSWDVFIVKWETDFAGYRDLDKQTGTFHTQTLTSSPVTGLKLKDRIDPFSFWELGFGYHYRRDPY